jgi:hypothetical protein
MEKVISSATIVISSLKNCNCKHFTDELIVKCTGSATTRSLVATLNTNAKYKR